MVYLWLEKEGITMTLSPFVALNLFILLTIYAQGVMWLMWERGICGCKRESAYGGLLILLSFFIFYLGWDACRLLEANEYVIGLYTLLYFFGVPFICKVVLKDLLDLLFGKRN
jgi:hypothetical protein